jgi:pSer/pThr/pTyr-binding forkhead associated (FHA) protein
MLKLEFTNFKQPSYWVVDELFEAGSTVKNGLKIEHPSLSARHATFKLSGAMLSVNRIGESLVLLNGEPIEGESNLTIGDHVTLGEVEIRVNDPALKQREAVPQLFSDPKVASLLPEQTRAEQVWKIKPLDKLVSQLVTVEGQLSIGRDPSNDLVVQGNHISRRHARFFIENGQLHIQDLDSSNGTYVNGERVKERSIFLGDKLRFDSSEFVVAVGKPKNALKDPEQDRTQFRAAITPDMLSKADEDADLDRDMLPDGLDQDLMRGSGNQPIKSVTLAELGAIPDAVIRQQADPSGSVSSKKGANNKHAHRTAQSHTTLYLLSFLAVIFLFGVGILLVVVL